SLAAELDHSARQEPPQSDLRAEPRYAAAYRVLLGDQVAFGPAFVFPAWMPTQEQVIEVFDEGWLATHFRGWLPGEIKAGRGPLLAVIEDGSPVSICFCARRSTVAAEAGLETAAGFRGRGFGPQVTAGWASAIRAQGLV